MGKRGHAIGMVLCIVMAIASQIYSEQINDLFQIDVKGSESTAAPLVGLQQNESWLVVLVDFDSNPLNQNAKDTIEDELQLYSEDYLTQAVGNSVELSIEIYNDILRAPKPLSAYGEDGANGRDYGGGTDFLPAQLAEFVVTSLEQESFEQYDLNDDRVIDRFLILHSTLAQEQGSGSSNRIWSHFTSFSEPLDKGEYSFEHYTMSSMRHGENGFGTILHEMMHQFGAFDLYPVHDSGYSGSWKGIGVWDIMASGNWNGGGDTPALPTGPTMAAIGHAATRDVNLQWPSGSPGPCIGPTVSIDSRTLGGDRIRIQISEDEFVWIEKRTQQGYDQSLPGEGVLVLLEDWAAGDSAHNAMNIDQRRPYLKAIEADGNQEQLKGINDGVAGDLFQPGDEFGERGILIRDHDGVLVPWHARIVDNDGQWDVEFHSLNCSPTYDIDLKNFGSSLLQDEQFVLEIINSEDEIQCWGSLNGTDGRTIEFSNNSNSNSLHFGTFSSQGMLDSTATFSGLIHCQNDMFDIKTTISTLGTIPNTNEMELVDTINVDKPTILIIPYIGEGVGSGEFTIEIAGPLSRVATANPSVRVDNGNGSITLEIEPQGLLQENMYVLGTIHLEAFNGEHWTIDVELKATSEDDLFLIGNQSFVFSTFFIVFAAWFATSLFGKKKKAEIDVEQQVYSDEEFLPGNHL
ncbi:MAG: hypothetical protein CMA41_01450 [Euryarchaeota archaeon]|jgi:M6 family metalloprotease-like protein|nr:hypothetical protein [Euryarchaeota archaeon]